MYEFKTTFWQDFTIADHFGGNAVKDTFDRAFEEWKTNAEYLTELVIVLNHKIWEHYEKDNDALAHLYNDCWAVADEYAMLHLKGGDLEYFLEVTD